MKNTYALEGRSALVTGGASGIGAAVVDALLHCGAHVTILDRARSAQPAAIGVMGDVSDRRDVARAVAAASDAYRPVDILVNAAGITGTPTPSLQMSDELWDTVIGVNTRGIINTMQTAVPVMVAQGWGRVVNLASLSAKEGLQGSDAYSASKAAVVSLTRTFGRDVAKTGVLINCVASTIINTPMLANSDPEFVRDAVSRIPMGRFGEPDELATFICFLVSEDMTFSTGICFDFSGGRANI